MMVATEHVELVGGAYCGQRATTPVDGDELLLAHEAFGEDQPRDDHRRVMYHRQGDVFVYHKVIDDIRQSGERNES